VQRTIVLIRDQDVRDIPLGDGAKLDHVVPQTRRRFRDGGHVCAGK